MMVQHDRINVERRVEEAPAGSKSRNVKTSDIARLMELFQVSTVAAPTFTNL